MPAGFGGLYDAGEDGRESWRVTGKYRTFLRSFDIEDFNKWGYY